jgi:hypothetical protein
MPNIHSEGSVVPNNVTTIVRAATPVIHALLTEEGVDFNRIIKMPDDVIRGGVGHAKIDGVLQKAYYDEDTRDEDGKLVLGKPHPYPEGATDWYEWSIANWGTKWNAYDHQVSQDDTVLRFDTAWSHPYPVMIRLSEMFPTELIQVLYADEDLGCNCAAYMLENGEITELPTPAEGTHEAADFASLVKYGVHYDDLDNDDEHSHFNTLEVLAHSLHVGGR